MYADVCVHLVFFTLSAFLAGREHILPEQQKNPQYKTQWDGSVQQDGVCVHSCISIFMRTSFSGELLNEKIEGEDIWARPA